MTESSSGIFSPVARDLAGVERFIRWELEHDPAEVGPAMAQLFESGGKRLRPALVLLSARFGNYDLPKLSPAAIAVELTHAATLVHDDVIDRSATRRGRPTIAASHGDNPAIVIGDYYFASAYEHAARTGSAEVVAILARAVMKICNGEVRQQAMRYRYRPDVEEYIERLAAKTAILIGACCDIGALLADVELEERAALVAYGQFIGIAFQIADDVLDYVGSEPEVGKPLGHDLLEGFATLPLILTPSIHIEDDRKLTEAEAREIVNEVIRADGPQLALARASDFANLAREQLQSMKPCDATDALMSLAEYVVTRKL